MKKKTLTLKPKVSPFAPRPYEYVPPDDKLSAMEKAAKEASLKIWDERLATLKALRRTAGYEE